MQFFDHAFFILVSIVAPILIYRSARKVQTADMTRSRNYLRNVLAWVAVPAVLLFKWISLGRPLGEIGLAVGTISIGWLACISVGVALVGFVLATQTEWGQKRLAGSALRRDSLHTPGMPYGAAELPGFAALDLAETTSDELVYRAFLWFYLLSFLETAVALAVMVAIFVGSESFRGRAGMSRAAVLGLVNSALLIASGAIWAGVAVQMGWRAARMAAVVRNW